MHLTPLSPEQPRHYHVPPERAHTLRIGTVVDWKYFSHLQNVTIGRKDPATTRHVLGVRLIHAWLMAAGHRKCWRCKQWLCMDLIKRGTCGVCSPRRKL